MSSHMIILSYVFFFSLEFKEPASHGCLYLRKERGMLITPGM